MQNGIPCKFRVSSSPNLSPFSPCNAQEFPWHLAGLSYSCPADRWVDRGQCSLCSDQCSMFISNLCSDREAGNPFPQSGEARDENSVTDEINITWAVPKVFWSPLFSPLTSHPGRWGLPDHRLQDRHAGHPDQQLAGNHLHWGFSHSSHQQQLLLKKLECQ